MRGYLIFVIPLLFSAQAGKESPSGLEAVARTPVVSLEELRANPDEYLGVRIKVTVTIGEEKEVGNPYFTRFNATNFVRFSARGISKLLWEPEIYSNEFSHIFVSKNSPYLETLRGAKKHERVVLTAIVRDAFRSIPWLEVVNVNRTGRWTPEGTLIAVARAKRLRSKGQGPLSLEALKKALIDPLPTDQKVAILREMASIHLGEREKGKARVLLQQALQLAPEDQVLKKKLQKLD